MNILYTFEPINNAEKLHDFLKKMEVIVYITVMFRLCSFVVGGAWSSGELHELCPSNSDPHSTDADPM